MPTILIVSASPQDQDRLRLGAEVRDIRRALQRSRNREDWKIESNEAVTVDDLRLALLDLRPSIVHFSGHGGGAAGLCFEDRDGNTHLTDAAPLARLFHHFKDELKCVVLNACYSAIQAHAINKEIDYVIGMIGSVDDNSASKFAVAFYDALFAGTDYQAAFNLGCTSLDLNELPDSDMPIFMTGAHLAPRVLSYSASIPEVERVLYAYFNTPFDDRSALTTSGDSLRSTMRSFYQGQMHRTVKSINVLSMKLMSADQWRVEISGGSTKEMYVRIRDRAVLVEWEASVGLWSMPPKTFLALGSADPIIARVRAELDNYYNYAFKDEKPRFQSIRLNVAQRGITMYGYVERGTDAYRELMEILGNGNEQTITVELRQVAEETDMPLIKTVLSDTWIYDAPDSL